MYSTILYLLLISVFFYCTGWHPATQYPAITSCLLGMFTTFWVWVFYLLHVQEHRSQPKLPEPPDEVDFLIDNPKFRVENNQLIGVEFMRGYDDIPHVGENITLLHNGAIFPTNARVTKVKKYKSTQTAERYVGDQNIANVSWGSLLQVNSDEVSDEVRNHGVVAVHWSTPVSSLYN
jgi:hypothetical protein